MATPISAPKRPESSQSCPCGSGRLFGECCEPVLTGRRVAATAEELMRARFTAHVVHDFKFLHETYGPSARQPYVEASGAAMTQWTKLVIHAHETGSIPDRSTVDFSAYGIEEGKEVVLHEKAEFVRQNGAWIYTRSLREGPVPFKAAAPKPGRNDPCPCGSGKKYKHCCLAKA